MRILPVLLVILLKGLAFALPSIIPDHVYHSQKSRIPRMPELPGSGIDLEGTAGALSAVTGPELFVEQAGSCAGDSLCTKYPGRVVRVICSDNQDCEIFLCGTMHVSRTSIDLVQETIRLLAPNFVVLELCEERLSTLEEMEEANAGNVTTLRQMVSAVISDRKWRVFCMDLLAWMQQKAGKLLGNKVGGEQCIAAKEGHRVGAALILGDRNYAVTIQRMMDRLNIWEKIKITLLIIWEVLTCNVMKVQDYLRRSEDEPHFVRDEMEELARSLPRVAEVLIAERDEYIAQTIREVAKVGFPIAHAAANEHVSFPAGNGGPRDVGDSRVNGMRPTGQQRRRRIVAVLGAAHLPGVTRWLQQGGVSAARVRNISISSQHECTWPGEGMLHVVNGTALYSPHA